MLTLDTHTIVWYMDASPRLGVKAKNAIETALARSQAAVTAITFWEVALLVSKDRVTISRPLPLWRSRVVELGFHELPLTGDIGILSVQLAGLHGDPADRLIAATCLADNSTLVTADRRLLGWSGGLATLDARL
ncbi:type II toxin-antitoxin system VapC family toxin [Oceanibaculum pacificum]|uniref:PIN domain-containing protein n=1 Tax=Oceanibaculum pacificum TaxID=580166 RepID=A0A154W862_9PROT|nr:type II toxin-antitoxin system VapC family toxin [Oceanibaculum pacificum]KZD09691.1 hypothetical protein AUP43_07015 [Oceanibaculum pacificum]